MLFMHNTHIFEELDQETKTKTANMNYQDALTVASMLVEVKRYSRGQVFFSFPLPPFYNIEYNEQKKKLS